MQMKNIHKAEVRRSKSLQQMKLDLALAFQLDTFGARLGSFSQLCI